MPRMTFNELKEKNPGKYPQRMGQPWLVAEEEQLLKEIEKKVPIEIIAELHERTEGGIRKRLKDIAVEYYFNKNSPINEIQKLTGLSIETISDAISKQEFQNQKKLKKQEKKKELVKDAPVFQQLVKEDPKADTKEIISLLKDIKCLLQTFLSNIHYEE